MAKPTEAKRRASDHGVALKHASHDEHDRRRTLGSTPSKHQVNLGSGPASEYFFGGELSKTPHSSKKRLPTPAKAHPKSPSPAVAMEEADVTMNMADTSILSAGTSSSEESDLLNKSVLSDTTELTASTFVLQASSRQRLLELSRTGAAMEAENVSPSNENKAAQVDDKTVLSDDSTPKQGESRLSKARRSSVGGQPEASTGAGAVTTPESSVQNDAVVAISEGKTLDGMLNNLAADSNRMAGHQESKTTPSTEQAQGASPSSTIASTSSPASTSKLTPSRLKPSPISRRTRLTPTKLSPSPRRIQNPDAADSPARNTRSAKRRASMSTTALPSKSDMDVDMEEPTAEENTGEKCSHDESDEEVGASFLTLRRTGGRISEITMTTSLSPMKKRRRSSISAASASESVHSSSTASTTDMDQLLGSLEPEKESADEKASTTHHAAAPSPATVASIPRSILGSSRRSLPGSHSRKSVVFGSPEAAEYRLGSPSVSLTPMPKDAAKAMYHIPSAQGSESSQSASSTPSTLNVEDEDQTIEIDANMSALLQQFASPGGSESQSIEYESSEMPSSELPSPSGKPSDGMDKEEIKKTTEGIVATSLDETSPISENASVGPSQPSEDVTVELEPDMKSLMATFGSPGDESMLLSEEKKGATEMESSPTDSVGGMGDAESARSQKPGRSFGSPEDQSLATASQQGDEEDNTVELEGDLAALLTSTSGGAISTARETPRPVALTEKYPMMEDMPRTDRMSFGEAMQAPTPPMTNKTPFKDHKTGSSDDDDAMEETVTRELETDLESLLRATGQAETPSASRRRSSHRFSLTPGRRLSVSMNGSTALNGATEGEVEAHAEVATNNTEHSQETKDADHPPEDFEADPVLDIDSNEIMSAAGLPETSSALRKENDSDTLASANTASKHFRNPLIAEAMDGFVFAVCGEIEKKAELSTDGSTCFAAIAGECPNQLLQLQKALRSRNEEEAAKSKASLQKLAQSVHEFVEFEWKTWEAQVIESLARAVDGIAVDFEEGDARLESSVTLADDALDAVSLMEGKAVQKARRRSMSRRKTASRAAEEEVNELEQQIACEKAELKALQARERTTVSFKEGMNHHNMLTEESKQSRALAESLQNNFMSLNGMHCWSPLVVGASKIEVGFIGGSPKTCMRLSFLFEKAGAVSCHANIDKSLFRQRRGKKLKLTSGTLAFLEANMATLIDSVDKTKLASGRDIGEMLQHLEMLHGRLEMTANEMFVLQKRFVTMLESDPVGKKADFLLSVDFKSRSNSVALRAVFELNRSYPFTPLNISLDDREEKVDVDLLKRQLVKNAKPGFGYLSRTCDTISAFLR